MSDINLSLYHTYACIYIYTVLLGETRLKIPFTDDDIETVCVNCMHGSSNHSNVTFETKYHGSGILESIN